MSFSILNNIPAMQAQDQLGLTNASLQSTLLQLSTGSRINTGADDPAGLSIANGLHANALALQQSSQNANTGVGLLQIADGALSQVTNLLNSAVTLATEASNGTETSQQLTALNAQFTQLMAEVDRIGTGTTYNGNAVFSASTTSIFLSDGNSSSTIAVTVGTLSSATLALNTNSLTTQANAQAALTSIVAAINTVDTNRGTIGATVNRLQDAQNVINVQVQNVTSAEDSIRAANIPQEVAKMSQYQILEQTGISALAQANTMQQIVLKLLQ